MFMLPLSAVHHATCCTLTTLPTATTSMLLPSLPIVYSNGTMQWVFRNASTIRIPGKSAAGFPVYEDVGLIPESMDIKAGDAYLHLIDLP